MLWRPDQRRGELLHSGWAIKNNPQRRIAPCGGRVDWCPVQAILGMLDALALLRLRGLYRLVRRLQSAHKKPAFRSCLSGCAKWCRWPVLISGVLHSIMGGAFLARRTREAGFLFHAHQLAHSPASGSDLAGTEPCTLVNPFSGWRHTVSWASASVCAFRSLSDTSSQEAIGPVFPDCHLHPRPAQVASCRQNRIPRCPQFPALSL